MVALLDERDEVLGLEIFSTHAPEAGIAPSDDMMSLLETCGSWETLAEFECPLDMVQTEIRNFYLAESGVMRHAKYPETVTLPNITSAEFRSSVERECRRRGVAAHDDFDTTCRSLAVQIFCDGDRVHGCATLATYLAAACNVRFRGE